MGYPLSPQQMRSNLRKPENGTLIYTTTTSGIIDTTIGVMPDLQIILSRCPKPDVYLRDNIADTGVVPTSGSISASPDIILVKSTVTDKEASFGETSGTKYSSSLGYEAEFGQPNYIYVRSEKTNKF